MPDCMKLGRLPFKGARLELLARLVLEECATEEPIDNREYTDDGLKLPVEQITDRDARFWSDIQEKPWKWELFRPIAEFAAAYLDIDPSLLTPETTRAVPVIYPAGKGLAWHTHDSAQIVTSVTLAGDGVVDFRDGQSVRTKAGMMMAIGRYTDHKVPVYRPGPNDPEFRVVIATNFLDERDGHHVIHA